MRIGVPMLHEKHIYLCFPWSMGVPKLLFATPPQRECQFCSPGTSEPPTHSPRTTNALTSNLDPLGVKSLHTCKRTEHIFKTFLSNEREGRSKKNSFQPIWLDVGKSNVAQRLLCVYLYLKHRLSTMKNHQTFIGRTHER